MPSQIKNANKESIEALHQSYMEVINAMPGIVYWVDKECNLIGCNNKFIKLLGLQTLSEVLGDPYSKMIESARWNSARIETLRLDDMKVLFSGTSQHNITEKPIEDENGKAVHFISTRVPMYNNKKEIIGLIVILTDVTLNKAIEDFAHQLLDRDKTENKPLNNGQLPNVLMVEDNLIAQNVEKALLTALNCHVDIAGTADIAVRLFDPGKYDLVLMDIGLEDSSGYIVAKQLRQKEKDTRHHVPIIALTGYEAEVVKYDCQHYFMEGAISKPLTSEQAEQLIKHYIYHMDIPVRGLKST